MKKYTKDEVSRIVSDARAEAEGIYEFPSGDYTEVKDFPERCSFGPGSIFGGRTSFGANCSFDTACTFGFKNIFGTCSSFAPGCRFGTATEFGTNCSFKNYLELEDGCVFNAQCSVEHGGTFYPVLTFGGFGRFRRTTYALNTLHGVIIRCGCFEGSLAHFRWKVQNSHGGGILGKEYLAIADLIELKWGKEDKK